MATEVEPPFSARNRGARRHIDNSFPESGRTGLLHLLHDLVERRYVKGWRGIARELERICRFPPRDYDTFPEEYEERRNSDDYLQKMPWDKVYDFCERLHGHLAEARILDWEMPDTPLETVQSYIERELQRLFLEEDLAFEFRDGTVERRGRHHTVEKVSRAQVVLGDRRLTDARKHYNKALQFFRHPSAPDYENAVKEAVCTVEAAGKALFPQANAKTLGDLTKWFGSQKEFGVPKPLIKTFDGIYGYRNSGEGVAHGGTAGGAATAEVTEYVLAVCASQIIYLVDLANSVESDIPF